MTIIDDIRTFLAIRHDEVFFNERDFQVQLASFLRESGNYDDVDLEYYVPNKILEGYVWKSELRLDIVARKNNCWIPVELKYKTKALKKNLSRFDETLENVVVLKNQGAQDLGIYDFWKDVKRLELVKKRFPRINSGVCVFLTNDSSYQRMGAKSEASCHEFSMLEGIHPKERHWHGSPLVQKTHPDFELDKEYDLKWQDVILGEEKFNACILLI